MIFSFFKAYFLIVLFKCTSEQDGKEISPSYYLTYIFFPVNLVAYMPSSCYFYIDILLLIDIDYEDLHSLFLKNRANSWQVDLTGYHI